MGDTTTSELRAASHTLEGLPGAPSSAHTVVATAPAGNVRWRYRPELDGCRAGAVLAVMGYHYFPKIFRGGYVGVEVFFVLSGYLITGLLAAEHRNRGRLDVGAFYIRRILRLYPALVAAVLGSLVLAAVTGHPGSSDLIVVEAAGAALLYVSDFALVKGRFTGFLDPTWSLAVEEQFYLVWPLALILALRRLRPAALGKWCLTAALVLSVASALLRSRLGFQITYFTPVGNAAALLFGCTIALRPGNFPRTAAIAGAVVLFAFVFTAPALQSARLWFGPEQVAAVAAAAGICWLANEGRSRVLANRKLTWVGRRSYGLYLWHQALLVAILHELPHASVAVVALIGIPLSFGVAELSHRFVEQPFLRRKRSFARVPDETAVATAAAA